MASTQTCFTSDSVVRLPRARLRARELWTRSVRGLLQPATPLRIIGCATSPCVLGVQTSAAAAPVLRCGHHFLLGGRDTPTLRRCGCGGGLSLEGSRGFSRILRLFCLETTKHARAQSLQRAVSQCLVRSQPGAEQPDGKEDHEATQHFTSSNYHSRHARLRAQSPKPLHAGNALTTR